MIKILNNFGKEKQYERGENLGRRSYNSYL